MKLSNIKNIEFWAREYKLPLFWLTDKDHLILKDDMFGFYKNSRLHFYFLNDRYQKEMQNGYKYFMKKGAFEKYERLCTDMLKKLNRSNLNYQKIKLQKLNNDELYNLFNKYKKVLNEYSNVYTKTEDIKIKKLETLQTKEINKKLHQIGKLRLDLRKAGEPIFYIMIDKILKEIAKKFNLTVNDLYFYNKDELDLLFKGKKLNITVLQNRKKGYVLWKMDGQIKILTGNKFKQMWKWVNEQFNTDKNTIIKGTIANKGKTQGVVRLILHNSRKISKQITQFNDGEILVTEMTRPSTIVACKKAAAIITDEGGLTCHAAIISREFNKPCVVGTKIATQVLKDGDLVEVDANTGEIKILERNK